MEQLELHLKILLKQINLLIISEINLLIKQSVKVRE